MKKFNDFIETLTEDKRAEIIERAGIELIPLKTSSDEKARVEQLSKYILAGSFSLSLSLLREYHEWLDSELR